MEKFYGIFDESEAQIYVIENDKPKYIAEYSLDNGIIYKVTQSLEETLRNIKMIKHPFDFVAEYLIKQAKRKYNPVDYLQELQLIKYRHMNDTLIKLFNSELREIEYHYEEEFNKEI